MPGGYVSVRHVPSSGEPQEGGMDTNMMSASSAASGGDAGKVLRNMGPKNAESEVANDGNDSETQSR